MNEMRLLFSLTVLISMLACVPPDRMANEPVEIDYSDEDHKSIRDLQDSRSTEELVAFLSDPDINIRYLSVNALASVQDTNALEPLGEILRTDPSEEVRYQAAYAIGQLYHSDAEKILVESFQYQDSIVLNNAVRRAVLEAVGKTGSMTSLDQIASVSTYGKNDHELLLGQVTALYRFGLRGMHSEKGTQKIIDLLTDKELNRNVRIMAANYLHRNRELDLTIYQKVLSEILGSEDLAEVRMTVVSALGRTAVDSARLVLLNQLAKENDYRVSCNILRSLSGFPYRSYRDSIIGYVNSKNPHIAIEAANLLYNHTDFTDRLPLLDLARNADEGPVKARLYGASLKVTPVSFLNTRTIIGQELSDAFNRATNAYEKIPYLNALSDDPLNLPVIEREGVRSDDPILQTAAIRALSNMMGGRKYELLYQNASSLRLARQNVLDILIQVMSTGNAGAIAGAARMLRAPDFGFKENMFARTPLRQALLSLSGSENEGARLELEKTLAYFNDTPYEVNEEPNRRGIDWRILNGFTDSTQAAIQTSKGLVTVKLLYKEAPSSVSNFVRLARDNYYSGKLFHRVVPNFVIQGGCPIGDGTGDLGYAIRSELGPRFYNSEGKMGMASAGKDTEGVQWFITHSPTPHLDGKYTIFAEVIDGQDVVDQILPGDLINQITITNAIFTSNSD